mmetsp:Transcript_58435/g.155474  ORF Transcript_58435/g.155474 Transcript_58435/m.155474 type:complete len:209 (+) Transcript_58435:366-992(+)
MQFRKAQKTALGAAIATSENVRHAGPHVGIDLNQTTCFTLYARCIEADPLGVWNAAQSNNSGVRLNNRAVRQLDARPASVGGYVFQFTPRADRDIQPVAQMVGDGGSQERVQVLQDVSWRQQSGLHPQLRQVTAGLAGYNSSTNHGDGRRQISVVHFLDRLVVVHCETVNVAAWRMSRPRTSAHDDKISSHACLKLRIAVRINQGVRP